MSLIPIIFLFVLISKYMVDVPFWDQWCLVPLLDKFFSRNLKFFDLWKQHNEHRLVFPKIIMLLLARFSRWNIFYELMIILFLAIGVFLIHIYLIKRTEIKLKTFSGVCLAPFVSLMTFSLVQWENWLWGWQIQIFLNIFASLVCITILTDNNINLYKFVIALFMMIIAALSFANGFILWPLGLIVIFKLFKKNRNIYSIIWFLIGLICFILYIYNYQKPINHPSVFYLFKKPVDYLLYILLYLGNPLVLFNQQYALVFGEIAIIIFIIIIPLIFISSRIEIKNVYSHLLIAFYSIFSGMVIGIGRAGFGYQQALSSRYTSFSLLFWISIIEILYIYIKFYFKTEMYLIKQKSSIILYVSIMLIIFITSLNFTSSVYSIEIFKSRQRYLSEAKNELLKDGNEKILSRLYRDLNILNEGVEILKKYHLSIFRENK